MVERAADQSALPGRTAWVAAGVAILTIIAVVSLSSGVSGDNPAAVATTDRPTPTEVERPTTLPSPTLAPFQRIEIPPTTIERGRGELLATIDAGGGGWELRRLEAHEGPTCVEFIPSHIGGWHCSSGPPPSAWSVIGAEDRRFGHELLTAEVGAPVDAVVVSDGSTTKKAQPIQVGDMRLVAIAWPLEDAGPLTLSFIDADGQTLDVQPWELGGALGG